MKASDWMTVFKREKKKTEQTKPIPSPQKIMLNAEQVIKGHAFGFYIGKALLTWDNLSL